MNYLFKFTSYFILKKLVHDSQIVINSFYWKLQKVHTTYCYFVVEVKFVLQNLKFQNKFIIFQKTFYVRHDVAQLYKCRKKLESTCPV